MTARDVGMVALGFVGGMFFVTFGLAAAMADIERGKSIDAMLRSLSARTWKMEKP
ncbi:MAG: hypothetical protein HY323_08070 [Betaproteobacteria bacterium]|nr:hypothetical protein [Betaproteobacteria bacterium]